MYYWVICVFEDGITIPPSILPLVLYRNEDCPLLAGEVVAGERRKGRGGEVVHSDDGERKEKKEYEGFFFVNFFLFFLTFLVNFEVMKSA